MKPLPTPQRLARLPQLAFMLMFVLFGLTASGLAAPVINSLSPSSGGVGTQVTISGNNFGASQGTNTVTFNGVAAAARGRLAVSWSNTSIVVNVPSGATTGNVVVTVAGAASNGVVFTIAPSITSLSPTSGPVATAVTITGTNFGATQGTSTVTFNGTAGTPSSWSNTSIAVPVPSGATSGNVVVTVNGAASNDVSFTVTPVIGSISPTSGSAGTVVTITGTNFGATQGSSTVAFNGTTATPTSWSATSVSVPVPNGATTGNIVVTVGGNASNGVSFTVTLGIASRSPGFGSIGTTVTINGSGFGPTQNGSTVTFNGTATTPTTWNAGTIVAPVPTGATSGNMVVTVSNTASNPKSFTVTPSPSNPAPTMTFNVNTTTDTVDIQPGDGVCADANGNCSVRAAVMESNAALSSGITQSVTISVPAGTYTLTILPDLTQPEGNTGHLAITNGPVSIVGASAATTIIQAGTSVNAQGIPNGIDKALSINPGGLFLGFSASFSNLTIRYGLNQSTSNPFGGAFDWDAGRDGAGSLSITNCNILNNATIIFDNTATNLADGGGVALTNEVPNPAVEGSITIINSLIQGNIAQDTGGGIFEGSFPMQVSNTTIQNNQAVDNPSVQGIGQTGGQQTGGGMSIAGPTVGPQTVIQSSTISNNTAGSQGGGIFTTAGIQVTSDVISGNHAGSTGAGLFSNPLNETTQVSGTNITQNVAGGDGGGVQVDNSNGNVFKMSFSRIVGNTGVHGSGVNNISGAVTATDNWWGCNQGPGNTGCDAINNIATAAFTPFLTLSNTPSPATIIAAQTSTLTASFLQDSANTTFAPGSQNMSAFNGLPVSFQNAIRGTLANPPNCQTTIQPNGTATCTFTGTVAGAASADAVVDQATATAHLQVQDFSLSISPASVAVTPGVPAVYTLTITPLNGFTGQINLSLNDGSLPTPSGCPTPVTITSGIVTCTITINTTGLSAQNGTLTVTGTSNAAPADSHTVTATLSIQDISINPPPSQSVVRGGSVSESFTLTSLNGYSGTVNLTCSISPSGAGVTITSCPSSASLSSGTATATLSVATSLTSTVQNYTITLTATFPGNSVATRSASGALSVTDFSLSISPISQAVTPGTPATYTLIVTPQNGFTGQVNLSGSLPGPVGSPTTCGASVTITSGPVNCTFTINTTGLAAQNYTLTVTGSSNAVPADSHSVSATLVVQDFTISVSGSGIPDSNGHAAYTVTVTAVNGFSGCVTFSVSGLPAGASSSSFNPASVCGSGSSTVTVTESSSTPSGTSTLTFTGTASTISHSTTATFTANGTHATATISINLDNNNCSATDGNGSTFYNSGTISVTINNTETESAIYQCLTAGPTYDYIQNLVNAINQHSPYVSASVLSDSYFEPGGSILLTSKAGGFSANYPLSVSATYNNGFNCPDPNGGGFAVQCFTGPAYAPSAPSSLSGGH